MRAPLAALALALSRRRGWPPSPAAAATVWALLSSSSETARASTRLAPSICCSPSTSLFSTSTSSSPLDAALAEAWASVSAAASPLASSNDDGEDFEEEEEEEEEEGEEEEEDDEQLDRAISLLEAQLVAGRKEEEGAAAPSPLSAAAAFEAVALWRLWRCSSSSVKRTDDDSRGSSLALAERAAARAVSIADAASEKTASLLAVRRLCSLRHAAALAALGGRDREAAEALKAFEDSSSSSDLITSLHLAEAKFYRELVAPRSHSSNASSLAAALSALDDDKGPFARKVRASALAALRGSLESLLSQGKLLEARRLAEAEAEALESRARAEEEEEDEEEGGARKKTETTTNSTSLPRRSSRPGDSSSRLPPPSPSAEAAAHARYRLATLAYSNGDRDSLPLARAALESSISLWGRQDDRSWLRRHRVAAAALADEILGLSSDSSSAAAASASSSLPANNDESKGEEPAATSTASSPPLSSSPSEEIEIEIESEASGALRRFRERLGGESGLAGEARLVSAAARLLRLREEQAERWRRTVSSASSSSSSPLAAFEAVLSPKREADAAAEIEKGFREMVRGCSGGAEHPLVKRASEVREALLLLESKEKTQRKPF